MDKRHKRRRVFDICLVVIYGLWLISVYPLCVMQCFGADSNLVCGAFGMVCLILAGVKLLLYPLVHHGDERPDKNEGYMSYWMGWLLIAVGAVALVWMIVKLLL